MQFASQTVPPREDRAAIGSLYNFSGTTSTVQRNYRDASNGMQDKQGQAVSTTWRSDKATPINVPGSNTESRRAPNRDHNPFALNRLHDTLSKPRAGPAGRMTSNLTASRTPLNMSYPSRGDNFRSGAKRPKVSKSGDAPVAFTSQYFGNPGAFMSAAGPSNGRKMEPIEVPDDDEDIGQPLTRTDLSQYRHKKSSSPDPIDSLPAAGSSHYPRLSHPFSRPSSPDPQRHSQVPDGDSTRRLRERVQQREPEVLEVDDSDPLVNDPIEAFSDDDATTQRAKTPSGRTVIPTNNVRKKVEAIETRNPQGVPHLNLTEQLLSVKGRMKGKAKEDPQLVVRPLDPQQCDAITTSASGFTPSSPPKRGRKTTTTSTRDKIVLPLDAWFLGCKHYEAEDPDDPEPPFWLRYEQGCERPRLSATLHIVEKPGAKTHIRELRIERDVEYITYTERPTPSDAADKAFVLQVKTRAPTIKPRNPIFEYTPGSPRPDGLVTFRFRTAHANWQGGEPYRKLIDALRTDVKESGQVNGTGSASLWEVAHRSAQHKKAQLERKGHGGLPMSSRTEVSILDSPKRRSSSVEDTELQSRPPPEPAPRTGSTYAERSMRQTRQSLAAQERAERAQSRKSPSPDADELILIWPPRGAGAVNITRGDMKRLQPDQYLNDTLIEFGLKLWLSDLRSSDPELADQVHVFSSFFYKKLNVKNKEEGYRSVRKWTSKFDLFKKKYLIVPINEHFHWYLAIIYNPEYVLLPPAADTSTTLVKPLTRKRKREEVVDVETADVTLVLSPQPSDEVVPDSCPPSPIRGDSVAELEVEELLKGTGSCSLSDGDSTLAVPEKDHEQREDVMMTEEPFDMELRYPDGSLSSPATMDIDCEPGLEVVPVESSTPSESTVPALPRSPQRVPTEVPAARFYTFHGSKGDERKPSPVPTVTVDAHEVDQEMEPLEVQRPRAYIFVFDSLGNRHPQAVKNLIGYLQMEAKDKKGLDETSPAEGKQALVPSQLNYSDCGVYLIHYVATFMSDPVWFSQIILSKKARDYPASARSQDWQGDVVSEIRANLATRIEELSESWKKERASKEDQTKKADGKSSSTTPASPAPDSDDDIIIENVDVAPPASTKAKAAPGRLKDAQKGSAQVGAATRLR
ncbi:hypothetical protein CERSUDRAFT_119788 [Gelatoporia subvermispora B]|uniref:Ubiquitin-like protease family profile domain-containing protein n=1 Tax=Ceriporiopsis subvermispora (strain B) TaxID=914234 RepID=M2QY07_CERS8|nr:hypothetical protein CERSUDRAFT_119788 [Gelatoporia subvermispora B]